MSESTFFSRLAKAQGQIKPASMDGVNPHFKSRYATLASLHAACMPALSENGLAVVQTMREADGLIWCKTQIWSDDGQVESEVPVAKPAQATPQAYGSALTYARRYSLAACLGLVADEDDDANAAQPQQAQQKPVQKAVPSDADKTAILAALSVMGTPDNQVKGVARFLVDSHFGGDIVAARLMIESWAADGRKFSITDAGEARFT